MNIQEQPNLPAPPTTQHTHKSHYALDVLEYFTKLTSWTHGDILVNRIFVTPEIIHTGLSNIHKSTLDDYYVVHTHHELSLKNKLANNNNSTKHRLNISIRSILDVAKSPPIFIFDRDLSDYNTDIDEVYERCNYIYKIYMETLFKYVKVGSYYIQESGDM